MQYRTTLRRTPILAGVYQALKEAASSSTLQGFINRNEFRKTQF